MCLLYVASEDLTIIGTYVHCNFYAYIVFHRNHSFIFAAFGELVLQEKKDVREMKRRLMAIEEQLQHFQSEDHDEVI